MLKLRNTKGVTLAELLLAIAILIVLSGVAFVSGATYMKNLRLNEMDSIAKELFIASQNQLTKAKASGSLQRFNFENGGIEEGNDYYVIYSPENTSGAEFLEFLLPFGTIDETIRSNGSYVIRYNSDTGTILQVYYSNEYNFSPDDLTEEFKAGIEDKDIRKNYSGHIIGYYYGDMHDFEIRNLRTPLLEIENGNKLQAKITVYDDDIDTLLCIEGLTSGAKKTIDKSIDLSTPNASTTVILDDITSSNHFSNVMNSDLESDAIHFIPGEDIEIHVVCQASGDVLSNVPESKYVTTNSLFSSLIEKSDETFIAEIKNIRHLENLDSSISGLQFIAKPEEPAETPELYITEAEQISDIEWTDFVSSTENDIQDLAGSEIANDNSFMPINLNPEYNFKYNGKNRYIEGINIVSATRNAALFGIANNVEIVNIELHNFKTQTTATGYNASTLVGRGENLTIKNSIAYNPRYKDEEFSDFVDREKVLSVNAIGGNAGGLVGNITSGTIENSVAAVYVKASGNAGGLVGQSSNTTISGSYAGGHTYSGVYLPVATETDTAGRPNIVGSKAGGLIGSANGGTITNCYATVSVQGSVYDDTKPLYTGTITSETNSYGTGLVCVKRDELDEITLPKQINEDEFLSDDMKNPVAYDPYHVNDYYPYKTISELNVDSPDVWFLQRHVGDWQLPGIIYNFVNGGESTPIGPDPLTGEVEGINAESYAGFSFRTSSGEVYTTKEVYDWSKAHTTQGNSDRWKAKEKTIVFHEGLYRMFITNVNQNFEQINSIIAQTIPLYNTAGKIAVYTPDTFVPNSNPTNTDELTIFFVDKNAKKIWVRYQNGGIDIPVSDKSGNWMNVTSLFHNPFGN